MRFVPAASRWLVLARMNMKQYKRILPGFALAGGMLLFGVTAAAENATTPGQVSSPYPTITNLAIEWQISGDDNLNGVVQVRYRATGEREWHAAMPLRRVPAGYNGKCIPPRRWGNKHSGSIFDLRPDTEYEIYLSLKDPDGGSITRTLRARTRPVPRAAAHARVLRTTPATLARLAANARPGDILLLAPGDYGAFTATRDGERRRPVVFRSAETGKAVFDSFSMEGRKFVHLEGASVNGTVQLLRGDELVVRRCAVNALYGIIAKRLPGARNCYIADNVVTGRMPWDKLHMGPQTADRKPACEGEGIEMTGPGNVICHNRVKGYRDCISHMEDRYAGEQVCIDIYNNDIYLADDDGVEADFAMGNCRVMRNRLTNCFVGLSSQPSLGGPTYFIRNVMYNLITIPFKLSNYSKGDVILHNTVIKVGNGFAAGGGEWSDACFRNNLGIGGTGGGVFGWRWTTGPGLAISLPVVNAIPDYDGGGISDADYDGAGTFGTPFKGIINDVSFEGVAQLRKRTTEKHGVQVDMNTFAAPVAFPDPPIPERDAPDLRLKPGSAAVDAGLVLPNVNDGYRGAAPDLGAYEVGDPLPVYGPRPQGVDEETIRRRK